MKFKILYLLLFVSTYCHADIYQCLNQNNQIEFRDKPCDSASGKQNLMSSDFSKQIDVLKTEQKVPPDLVKNDKQLLNKSADPKLHEMQVKLDKKKVSAERKRIRMMQKEERKNMRIKKREEKLALKETQKKEKQLKKQKKLSDKIEKIENQLRLGAKLKNVHQLSSKLEKVRKNLADHPKKQSSCKKYQSEELCQNQL